MTERDIDIARLHSRIDLLGMRVDTLEGVTPPTGTQERLQNQARSIINLHMRVLELETHLSERDSEVEDLKAEVEEVGTQNQLLSTKVTEYEGLWRAAQSKLARIRAIIRENRGRSDLTGVIHRIDFAASR